MDAAAVAAPRPPPPQWRKHQPLLTRRTHQARKQLVAFSRRRAPIHAAGCGGRSRRSRTHSSCRPRTRAPPPPRRPALAGARVRDAGQRPSRQAVEKAAKRSRKLETRKICAARSVRKSESVQSAAGQNCLRRARSGRRAAAERRTSPESTPPSPR